MQRAFKTQSMLYFGRAGVQGFEIWHFYILLVNQGETQPGFVFSMMLCQTRFSYRCQTQSLARYKDHAGLEEHFQIDFWNICDDVIDTGGGRGGSIGNLLHQASWSYSLLLQILPQIGWERQNLFPPSPLDGDEGAQWSLRWFTPTNEVNFNSMNGRS